jgi:hypothetical protein
MSTLFRITHWVLSLVFIGFGILIYIGLSGINSDRYTYLVLDGYFIISLALSFVSAGIVINPLFRKLFPQRFRIGSSIALGSLLFFTFVFLAGITPSGKFILSSLINNPALAEQAADEGQPNALFAVRGMKDLPSLLKAADRGDPRAMALLILLYGAPDQDPELAARLQISAPDGTQVKKWACRLQATGRFGSPALDFSGDAKGLTEDEYAILWGRLLGLSYSVGTPEMCLEIGRGSSTQWGD